MACLWVAAATHYLTTNFKLFPQRNIRVEKVLGCDHMTCKGHSVYNRVRPGLEPCMISEKGVKSAFTIGNPSSEESSRNSRSPDPLFLFHQPIRCHHDGHEKRTHRNDLCYSVINWPREQIEMRSVIKLIDTEWFFRLWLDGTGRQRRVIHVLTDKASQKMLSLAPRAHVPRAHVVETIAGHPKGSPTSRNRDYLSKPSSRARRDHAT